jgi:hypothetical protein
VSVALADDLQLPCLSRNWNLARQADCVRICRRAAKARRPNGIQLLGRRWNALERSLPPRDDGRIASNHDVSYIT